MSRAIRTAIAYAPKDGGGDDGREASLSRVCGVQRRRHAGGGEERHDRPSFGIATGLSHVGYDDAPRRAGSMSEPVTAGVQPSGLFRLAVRAARYGDGADRTFLDSPRAEWEYAEANDLVVHVHRRPTRRPRASGPCHRRGCRRARGGDARRRQRWSCISSSSPMAPSAAGAMTHRGVE
jgi:hypothetical protein